MVPIKDISTADYEVAILSMHEYIMPIQLTRAFAFNLGKNTPSYPTCFRIQFRKKYSFLSRCHSPPPNYRILDWKCYVLNHTGLHGPHYVYIKLDDILFFCNHYQIPSDGQHHYGMRMLQAWSTYCKQLTIISKYLCVFNFCLLSFNIIDVNRCSVI